MISKLLFTTGTIALTATSMGLVAGSIALRSYETQPKTLVNLQPISWVFNANFAFHEKADFSGKNEIELKPFQPVALLKIKKPVVKKVFHRVIAQTVITDSIHETRAAPGIAPILTPKIKMNIPAQEEKAADAEEMIKMQQLHKMLHTSYVAQLDHNDLIDEAEMTTQLAIQDSPALKNFDDADQVTTHVSAPAVLVAEEEVSVAPVMKRVIHHVIRKLKAEKAKEIAQRNAIRKLEKQEIHSKAKHIASTVVPVKESKIIVFPKIASALTNFDVKKVLEERPAESKQIETNNNYQKPQRYEQEIPAPQVEHEQQKPLQQKQEIKTIQEALPVKKEVLVASNSITTPIVINIPRWSDYSPTPVAVSPAPAQSLLNTQPEKKQDSNLVAMNTQSDKADSTINALNQLDDIQAVTFTPADTVDTKNTKTKKDLESKTKYIEAFYWGEDAVQVQINNLTYNKVESTGWKIASSSTHWNTLYWSFSKEGAWDGATPLIANNTVRMLAALVGNEITVDTGIIFGKLAKGWKAELSGRSDRVIYLDSKNQVITAGSETSDEEKYFAILNAAPGAHLLYVTDLENKSEGAVGIPVVSGHATYLDLSEIQMKTFSGRIADGSATQFKGLKGVQVQVVGQSSAAAVSKRSGEFKISNVVTIGNYPVFIETTRAKGFTYRSKIHPDHLEDIILYQMSDQQIGEWIGQLEGGVSPESGVVLAAIPGVVVSGESETLYAVTKPLLDHATLLPETYTISAAGKLQVGMSLVPASARSLSVQVPEGPMVYSVQDKNGKTLWSELVISSPRVVNVVGPY